MLSNSSLTTQHVFTGFAEGIAARGGKVTEAFNTGRLLFARAVLPLVEEVQPGDELQGGVALKATAQDVGLFPYLFRAACQNGAILVEGFKKQSLGNLLVLESDQAARAVREGIEACSSPDVFRKIISKVRRSFDIEVIDVDVEIYFSLATLLDASEFSEPDFALSSEYPRVLPSASALSSEIADRFERQGDSSRYGLANAFTSLARDTKDPELKWDLEELGGAIALGKIPVLPTRGGQQAAAKLPGLVPVG